MTDALKRMPPIEVEADDCRDHPHSSIGKREYRLYDGSALGTRSVSLDGDSFIAFS